MNINMPAAPLPISQNEDTMEKARQLQREKDLEKACEGFEAMMLNSLMKAMRDTLPGDTLFPQNNASDIYQSLHDQHLTDKLSQGKQVTGFKEFLYRQLQGSL